MDNGVRAAGEILSKKNSRVKDTRKLQKRTFRYQQRKFLAEGIQVIREALYAGVEIETLFFTPGAEEHLLPYADLIEKGCRKAFRVSDEVISYLTDTVNPQGMIAVFPFVHEEDLSLVEDSGQPLVLLDRVRDPGNLGAMIRAADAAGMKALLVSEESADIYNPKVVRASAGSIFHLPLFIEWETREVITRLKSKGYTVVATTARGEVSFWDYPWTGNTLVMLGNEAWGIPPDDEELADARVRVPIFGKAESLNVATAATLIFYEIERRLRVKDKG